MKKNMFLLLLLAIISLSCTSTQFLDTILTSTASGLTEKDAASGIVDALLQGTTKGVQTVSKLNGYFGNSQIKIPFPEEAAAIEKSLKAIGLNKQVDQVVLSLNRAAENAAQEAKPIFVAAIKNMTISDALDIVKGSNDAATRYLQRSTSSELSKKFQPVIKNSLDKVNGTKYWSDVITTYNAMPFVEKINPNLTEYVTSKAMEGLFTMIAKEELSIRKDPAARTTDLLKKVFGNKN